MNYSSTSRQAKRYTLRLFALTIGILMIILSSGCQPTRFSTDGTETRDSVGQIQNSSDSTFVKVTISVKTVNDTVIDDRCHERFCYLTIRETVYQTRDSLQVGAIKHKKKMTSSPFGIPRVASFWHSSSSSSSHFYIKKALFFNEQTPKTRYSSPLGTHGRSSIDGHSVIRLQTHADNRR